MVNKKEKIVKISLIVGVPILLFVVPMAINTLYPPHCPLISCGDSIGLMGYIGTVMGCIATIILGMIATYQTLKANEINERLLKLEESSKKAYLTLDISSSKIRMQKDNRGYSCKLVFENISDVPIINTNENQFCGLSASYFMNGRERRQNIGCSLENIDSWRKIEFIIPIVTDKAIILHLELNLTSLYWYNTKQLFQITIWKEEIIDFQIKEL